MEANECLYKDYLFEEKYCKNCEMIPWETMIKEILEYYNIKERPRNELHDDRYHSSSYVLKSLYGLKLPRPSCPLCQMIRQRYHLWTHESSETITISLACSINTAWKYLSPSTNEKLIDLPMVEPCVSIVDKKHYWHLEIDNDSPFKPYARNSVTTRYPHSRRNLAVFPTWIRNCDQGHELCASQAKVGAHDQTVFPTRLLRINHGVEDEIILVDSDSLLNRPKYVALSHCWGTEQLLRTTNDTIERHRQGIKVAVLPRTFQDAIFICNNIQIDYLWIDSLCIVQDDTNDWEIEAAKMGSIYKFAYVTIAASRARSDNEGFLDRPCLFYYGEDEAPSADRRILCEPAPGLILGPLLFCPGKMLSYSPLNERGWVLQERYMSPRTLHFTDEGVWWSCNSIEINESGSEGDIYPQANMTNILNTAEQFPGASRTLQAADMCGSDIYIMEQSQHHQAWYIMLNTYSKCDLTRSEDRLPALSGLAAEIDNRTQDKYYAGLWKSSIILGLQWRVVPDRDLCRQPGIPSWSWVAVKGPIKYETVFIKYYRSAVVNDISVQLKGVNIYGEVSGGRLYLCAPVLPVGRVASSNEIGGSVFVIMNDMAFSMSLHLDDFYNEAGDADPTRGQFVLLSFTTSEQSGDPPQICALLLRPDEEDRYQRVGIAESNWSSWIASDSQHSIEDFLDHWRKTERPAPTPRENPIVDLPVMREWIKTLPKKEFCIV